MSKHICKADLYCYDVLRFHYPEYKLDPVQFDRVPRGYWKLPQHQRAFMDKLARELNITGNDDWLRVSREDIIQAGGIGILKYHSNCLPKLLAAIYPELRWDPMKFNKGLGEVSDQRKFLENIMKKMNITNPEEFATMRRKDIVTHASPVLQKYKNRCHRLSYHRYGGSMYKMLKTVYPEYPPFIFDELMQHIPMGSNKLQQSTPKLLERPCQSTEIPYQHDKRVSYRSNIHVFFTNRNKRSSRLVQSQIRRHTEDGWIRFTPSLQQVLHQTLA